MATVVNDRDVLILAAVPRYSAAIDQGMFVTPSSAIFKVVGASTGSPSSITFNANLLNMSGTVTWTASAGLTLTKSGNSATLSYANMSAASGTVTASITVDGQTYTQTASVTKVADGIGQNGVRGNVNIAVETGSSVWSDTDAAAEILDKWGDAPRNGDTVELYNKSAGFIEKRLYDGDSWEKVTQIVDGNALIPGTVYAEAIDARGLSIKDLNGNVILSAGKPLAEQVPTNPNLCPAPRGLKSVYPPGRWSYVNRNGDVRFGDGQYCGIAPVSSGQYVAIESPPLGIPAGAQYTVSFDAFVQGGAPTRVLNVDVFGPNYDGIGISQAITTTMTRYSFTNTITSNSTDAPKAYLRMWAGSLETTGDIIIANIKVELGDKITPWCDTIVTQANASTYIAEAAINLVHINKATILKLSALNAFLGSVEIGAGGNLRQGQWGYDSGTGFWLGDDNGTPKFSIGQAGGSALLWNGSNLVMRNPTISSGYSVAVSSSISGARSNGTTTLGTVTLNVTGGLAPYAYSWVITGEDMPGQVALSSYGSSAATVTCKPGGSNQQGRVNIVITITDANGLTISKYVSGTVTWGTPV